MSSCGSVFGLLSPSQDQYAAPSSALPFWKSNADARRQPAPCSWLRGDADAQGYDSTGAGSDDFRAPAPRLLATARFAAALLPG